METYLTNVCSLGCQLRKQEYDGLRGDQGSLSGDFACDLMQNANRGSTPGATVPSLNTHPELFNYHHGRL
eukprot:8974994-Lingulodinium_polyedra.AAC.1